MNKFLNNQEKIPLGTQDILKIMRPEKAVQIDYDELIKKNSLLGAFPKGINIILLYYDTKGSDVGHWVLLFKSPKKQTTIHYWDSYGQNYRQDIALTHNKDGLTSLINQHRAKGYEFIQNKNRYQKFSKSIETCGRWCGLRGRFRCFEEKDFQNFFKYNGIPGDELVTLLTGFFAPQLGCRELFEKLGINSTLRNRRIMGRGPIGY